MAFRQILQAVFLGLVCASCAHAGKTAPGFTPYTVEDFALLDNRGQFHELDYYSDQKAVVLIAQGNGCPIIRKSTAYLNNLADSYRPQGIVFLMVNANLQDDRSSIIKEAADFDIRIPVLEDRSQLVSTSLRLTRTGEAVVIDPKTRTVIYRGPIHDGLDYEVQKEIRHHYLRDAIDALLAHRPVSGAPETKGCLINFEKDRPYTYTADVAPVLIKNCIQCHSSGGVAPWSMDDYAKVKGWGRMIAEVVRRQRMPPWHADPHYGRFKNDIALSPQEVRTLIEWVKTGLARGEGDDPLVSAPRPKFEAWTLGQPDVIFSLPQEEVIPPSGTLTYRLIEADHVAERDMWVRAMDLRPGNIKAVHHCDVSVQLPPDVSPSKKEKEANAEAVKEWTERSGLKIDGVGQIIAGYAPGYASLFELPPDTGLFIPKGSKIVFLMHYITTGKPEKDLTKFGLYLYKEKPANVYSVVQLSNKDFKIPAGAKDFRLSASHVFDQDVVLSSLTPHMHYRGRSMTITAHYPDGSAEVLLSVPNYKFNWQRRYILAEPKTLPAGTTVTAEGVYDNSAQNPDNPDPSKDVVFGPQSDDEMFSAFLSYTILKKSP